MAGKIDGEESEDNEDTGYYMPRNIQLKKYKDYDKPLRKKEMEYLLTHELDFALSQLEENKIF